VFSPFFQLSFHFQYFFHPTAVILFIYLVVVYYRTLPRRWVQIGKWLIFFVTVVVFLNGFLSAYRIVNKSLSFNKGQFELAGIISDLHLNNRNLIIAPARGLDDASCWLPLITSAHVLFCRDANFALPRKQAYEIYFYRESLYLYLIGRDSLWLKTTLCDGEEFLYPTTLLLFLWGPEREKVINYVKSIMLPYMSAIEAGDYEAKKLLRGYSNIVIVDRAEKIFIKNNHLSKYLSVYKEERQGSFILLWCRPL
jgi:hypothetical protein